MPDEKQRVIVVTDSTSDLPRSLVQELDIRVVPQILMMGDKTWLDGVDIDSATFYELLKTSSLFPRTSQPSAAFFIQLFTELSYQGGSIAAILISDELSGTLNSARTAALELPDLPLEIVDSRNTSMGLGLIVLAAARAAAAGADLKAVTDTARGLIDRLRVYFVVDTLEYLHRGGRIGGAAKLFGTALNLKPVLEVRSGRIEPVAKIRTRRKALDKMIELLQEQISPQNKVHMSVLHVAAPEEAAQLARELEERFHPSELVTSECGPVVGAHAGPGTTGVAFYVE